MSNLKGYIYQLQIHQVPSRTYYTSSRDKSIKTFRNNFNRQYNEWLASPTDAKTYLNCYKDMKDNDYSLVLKKVADIDESDDLKFDMMRSYIFENDHDAILIERIYKKFPRKDKLKEPTIYCPLCKYCYRQSMKMKHFKNRKHSIARQLDNKIEQETLLENEARRKKNIIVSSR